MSSSPVSFEVKIQKACGIDLHKDSIKACYMFSDSEAVYRDYGTQSHELRKLCAELVAEVSIDFVKKVRASLKGK